MCNKKSANIQLVANLAEFWKKEPDQDTSITHLRIKFFGYGHLKHLIYHQYSDTHDQSDQCYQ